MAYLRREAAAVFDQALLMARARAWLVEHDYLLPRERNIRRLMIAARRYHEQILFRIAPFEPERQATQVAAVRQELERKSHDLARLLNLARAMPLAVPAGHALAVAFATLDPFAPSSNGLPAKAPQPFGASWQDLLDQPDRAAALGCFRAASLMALKRALRNRSVSVDHTLSYRAPENRLIPLKLWQRDRGRFIRDFNLCPGWQV